MKRLWLFCLVLVLFVVVSLPSMAFGQDQDDGKKRLYFPQIPIGEGWKVVLNFLNVTEESHEFENRAFLYNEHGIRPPAKFFLSEEDFRANSRVIVSESAFIGQFHGLFKGDTRVTAISKTEDSPGLLVGWMELIQDDEKENVSAHATLQYWENGVKVSEVGVPAVVASQKNFVQVFLGKENDQKTGLAIANPHNVPVEVTITFSSIIGTVFYGNGGVSKKVILPKKGHFSKFVTEIFPEYESDGWWQRTGTLSGKLEITSTLPVPVLALRTSVVPGVGFMMSTLAASSGK